MGRLIMSMTTAMKVTTTKLATHPQICTIKLQGYNDKIPLLGCVSNPNSKIRIQFALRLGCNKVFRSEFKSISKKKSYRIIVRENYQNLPKPLDILEATISVLLRGLAENICIWSWSGTAFRRSRFGIPGFSHWADQRWGNGEEPQRLAKDECTVWMR